MELVPMTPDDMVRYREQTIAEFAQEKVNSEGIDLDAARKAAEASWERANPEKGDGHTIGRLHADGEPVGVLWFGVRPEWGKPCVWLYDIRLDPQHRGRGLGRQAMALLEREAQRLGVHSIGLHVFGHNTTARALYAKLGYRETSVIMRKDVGGAG